MIIFLITQEFNKMKNILQLIPFHKYQLFFLTILIVSCSKNPGEPETEIDTNTRLVPQGVGKFTFDKYLPLSDTPITVHTYLPDSTIKDITVIFVMHGTSRNASGYCIDWVDPAREYNFLVICPDIDANRFPGSSGYNLGGMYDGNVLVDSAKWSFALIEPIFKYLKSENVTTSETYGIYGHSAGSQFVHRYALFTNPTNAKIFIAANAGWYTMTDFTEVFPYGFQDSPMIEENIKGKLGLNLVILLGENDTDPNASSLRKTEEAMRQGKHRFERGHTFYNRANLMADSLGVKFNWTLQTVPNVGHSNFGMAPSAAKILFQRMNN